MFRLNLEQQGKRAQELLQAASSGDAGALGRFSSQPPQLAEAQALVARELRFKDWAQLETHIAQMAREREDSSALDADLRTLHIRCGSDLKKPLHEAGFQGDFYEHSYPYLAGPVREGKDALEQRAHFLTRTYGDSRDPPLQYEAVLQGLLRDEQTLLDSSSYERVVIWSEGDCYDQLVLLRLLGHYATHPRPQQLELINVGDFPGGTRFIGLGQLPPEALRMLWSTRRVAQPEALVLGLGAWRALANPDPRPLAAIMRSDTFALPLMAPALHRHLRELPSSLHGLSFTQELALIELAQQDFSLNQLFGRLNSFVDPLPGQGDLQMRDRLLEMEAATDRVFTRQPGVGSNGQANPPWTDVFTITELGRAVLGGEIDFMSLNPPTRWVGGAEVGTGHPDWRWDEARKDAIKV